MNFHWRDSWEWPIFVKVLLRLMTLIAEFLKSRQWPLKNKIIKQTKTKCDSLNVSRNDGKVQKNIMWACLTYFKLNTKSLKQKHLCEAYNIRFAPFIQTLYKSRCQNGREKCWRGLSNMTARPSLRLWCVHWNALLFTASVPFSRCFVFPKIKAQIKYVREYIWIQKLNIGELL